MSIQETCWLTTLVVFPPFLIKNNNQKKTCTLFLSADEDHFSFSLLLLLLLSFFTPRRAWSGFYFLFDHPQLRVCFYSTLYETMSYLLRATPRPRRPSPLPGPPRFRTTQEASPGRLMISSASVALCLGSEGGNYYTKEAKLTQDNAKAIARLLAAGLRW